jgi:hypothetical protein
MGGVCTKSTASTDAGLPSSAGTTTDPLALDEDPRRKHNANSRSKGLPISSAKVPPVPEQGINSNTTLGVMFRQIDKQGKGFISRADLDRMMSDDKLHFGNKDVDHILEKYGTDQTLSFAQFETWWGSTYTAYNDDHGSLAQLVDEVHAEHPHLALASSEGDSSALASTNPDSVASNLPPIHTSVAVGRS